MSEVAVLIPGIMGSQLELDGEVVWPGPVKNLVLTYDKMDKLMSDRLKATDVIRTYAWFFPQYQTLIDDMATLGLREDQGRMVVFAYDWRKSNEIAAASLADVLDKVIEKQGVNAKITLLAHSMGGLISRYLLESGKFADRRFFKNINRCVFLGTPHKGAPLALARILGQEKAVWLSADQIKQAVNDPRFPSAYQLLPPPTQPFLWNETVGTLFDTMNLYDEKVAQGVGLNPAILEQGRAFHAALDPAKRPEWVRYFCFNGTQHKTAVFSGATAQGSTKFGSRKIEREGSGDGVVPVWSSILDGVQSFTVGGEHSVIYQDSSLRRVLSALMGKPGKLGAVDLTRGPAKAKGEAPKVEISVRDKVLESASPLHFVVSQIRAGATLSGKLRIEKLVDETAETPVFEPVGEPLEVEYSGPSFESIALQTESPEKPGMYRIAYYPKRTKKSVGSGAFVVQGTD